MKKAALSLITVFGLTSLATPARAALVGYYNFDNSANPFEDSSGAGNHITGSINTAPTWGSAFGYNGSGAHDYAGGGLSAPVDVNPGVMPQMTWGAWVRTDTLVSGHHQVLSHENGGWDRTLGLSDRPDGGAGVQYTAFTGAGATGSAVAASTTAWSFVATLHNQTTNVMTLFVDLDASTTGDALLQFTTTGATFGDGNTTTAIGAFPSGSESWDGAIDQVFIFNEELSNAQLTQFRNQGFVIGIPEPSSALLAGMALVLMRRRRR